MAIHSTFGDIVLHMGLVLFSLAASISFGSVIGQHLGYQATARGRNQSPPPSGNGCLISVFLILGLPCIAFSRQLSTNGYNTTIKVILIIAGLLPFIISVTIGYMTGKGPNTSNATQSTEDDPQP